MKQSIIMKILSIVFAAFALWACGEDDKTPALSTDETTQQILNTQRLEFEATGGNTNLQLDLSHDDWTAEVDSESKETVNWCRVKVQEIEGCTYISITAARNSGINHRESRLILTSKTRKICITVNQKSTKQMRARQAHVDAPNNGGNVYVRLYTNVEPQVDMSKTAPWLELNGVQRIDRHPQANRDSVYLVYHFTAKANPDLGRATTIAFTNKDAAPATVTIHQWGRPFNESESIHVAEPGQLGILLGGNANHWAAIRSLTLSGTLNTTDMQALRHLLSERVKYIERSEEGHVAWAHTVMLGVKHLDMSACTLIGGGQDYEESSISARFDDTYRAYGSNQLNDAAFKILRMPLETLILPNNLESIGGWAFYYSYYLRSIDIPASVKHIGPYAFHNCQALTRINIPENSQLQTLGVYALATQSKVEEIRFPATLTIDEAQGPILGTVPTKKIHVKWPVPPVLKRYGINRNATLYVPQGTAEAYRQAYGWSRAAQIIEE